MFDLGAQGSWKLYSDRFNTFQTPILLSSPMGSEHADCWLMYGLGDLPTKVSVFFM
jgi:hypothetical protein